MSNETNTTEQTTQAAPALTLNDLAAVLKLIEVINGRGAFKPEEMQAVGILYQKIALFLQASQPAPAEATPENESASGVESTEADVTSTKGDKNA